MLDVYVSACSDIPILIDPEDGSIMFFRNVGRYSPKDTASRPSRLSVLYRKCRVIRMFVLFRYKTGYTVCSDPIGKVLSNLEI